MLPSRSSGRLLLGPDFKLPRNYRSSQHVCQAAKERSCGYWFNRLNEVEIMIWASAVAFQEILGRYGEHRGCELHFWRSPLHWISADRGICVPFLRLS